MQRIRKKTDADLKRHYNLLVETGLIIVLVILLLAAKVEIEPQTQRNNLTEKQDVVKMEEVVQTKQQDEPPVPPKPEVPVEVPNDEIVKEQNFNLNSDLDLDDRLEVPPPPRSDKKDENKEKIFKVVENQPSLKGGMSGLYNCIQPYPERARRAGIEGTVIVKAIVNKQGKIKNAHVIRGIGGGADEKALHCVEQAEFVPGRQRGRPVNVQMQIPVRFKLQH